MPGMNGRELTQRLLLARPETKVIHMSGYTDQITRRERWPKLGTAFLAKPFSLYTLGERIREIIHETRHSRSAAEVWETPEAE